MLKIVLLSVVFFVKTFNAATTLSDDSKTNATISIIAGIMNGVTNTNNLDQLQECLKNNTDITDLLDEIKEDISAKNINSMFEGMRNIGKLVVKIPEALKDCGNMTDQVKLFKNWVTIFTKPEELYTVLVKNVPLHFTEMWADIQDAMSYYQKGDYYNYGRNLAQTMVLAVGEAEQKTGIMKQLDSGYQKFKSWIDHYVVGSKKTLTEEVIDKKDAAMDKIEDIKDMAKDKYEDLKDKAKETYEETKDKAMSLGEQIAESVKGINPMKWW